VHGFDRGAELREAINARTTIVVEHLGRITGYATGLGFFVHAVAETNQDLKSLIAAAPKIQGPGFLLPGEITRFSPGASTADSSSSCK
jgi:hypothetical protein